MAEKENENGDEIDLTTYEFATTCGVCHPGGAGLEYDRSGRRYDITLETKPQLKEQFDGDYYHSNWDKSGVLEADCLVCHLPNYDYEARKEQISSHNLRWAATVGAGLASVSGKVSEGENPRISYDLSKFNAKGKAELINIDSPEDENCLQCHAPADMKKRGFSWNDEKNPDVHNTAGMNCIDCHALVETEEISKMQHQIAKGDASLGSVAPELDNTMLSCQDCHDNGINGAPVPQHENVKKSHLDFISCEACHIPYKNRAAGGVVDASTGKLVTLPNVKEAKGLGAEARWQPELHRNDDGKIYPLNVIHPVWWGNKDGEKISPLFLREIKPAFERAKSKITDDNGDGKPEVNSEDEIKAMLDSLKITLEDNKRLSPINPVYVKGGKVYELDSSGEIVTSEHPVAEAEGFSISHNVAPAEEALGANGCSECHSSDSRWVVADIMNDPFGPDGKPTNTTQGDILGISSSTMGLHGKYQSNFNWLLVIGTLGILILCLIHYAIIGPNAKRLGKLSRSIQRYSSLERWTHNIRMVSCILLMVTGAGFALYSLGLLKVFGGYQAARTIHIILGVLFIISSLVATVIWFRNCLPESHDIKWLKQMGGYLTKEETHPPASRFNAGQKLFYWFSTILSIIIIVTGIMLINRDSFSGSALLTVVIVHGVSALGLIAGVAAHAYLGSLANPGTFKVLVDGKVAEEWAKAHHPLWDWKNRGA